MGQYFRIVNLDKKEWIDPVDGHKLWEICANNTIRMLGYLLATNDPGGTGIPKHFHSKRELEELLMKYPDADVYMIRGMEGEPWGYIIPRLKYFGRWAGDRIIIVGESAEYATNVPKDCPSYHELPENPEWRNITEEVAEEFNDFIEEDDLKVRVSYERAWRSRPRAMRLPA